MLCPHCASSTTRRQAKTTALGYQALRCAACLRTFKERTGARFNFLEYPTDIVLLMVLWRRRCKLSLRDLAEMFLERGFVFTHEAVREWEERFAPLLAERRHAKKQGRACHYWCSDETYIAISQSPGRSHDADGRVPARSRSATLSAKAAELTLHYHSPDASGPADDD
jgi:putative transposase